MHSIDDDSKYNRQKTIKNINFTLAPDKTVQKFNKLQR